MEAGSLPELSFRLRRVPHLTWTPQGTHRAPVQSIGPHGSRGQEDRDVPAEMEYDAPLKEGHS